MRAAGERVLLGAEQGFVYHVVEDDAANAFILPGGFVFVTLGLVDVLGGDLDELGVVLCHEAAHVRARHAAIGDDTPSAFCLRQE